MKCPLTQHGYNIYWDQMQTYDPNLKRYSYSANRKCTCGKTCHQIEALDKIKVRIVTTNITSYVLEKDYNKSNEWQVHKLGRSWPKEFTDIKTKTTYTLIDNYSYRNNSDNTMYHLTEWQYRYDNRRTKRESRHTTGGNEIMEKKYVTKQVEKTRKVYGTQH